MKESKVIALIFLVALVFILGACNGPGHECPPPAISNITFPHVESVRRIPGAHQGQLPPFEEVKTTEQSANQSITKNINDEKVTGTYLYSTHNNPDTFYTRVYQTQEGRLFGSDKDGILRFYTWEIDAGIKTVCTEQECQAIAKKFLTPYVDVENYKVSTVTKEDGTLYEFTFKKYYGDHPTVDHATVTIHQSGQLYAYCSTMFGKLPDHSDHPIDETKLNALIEQNIESMYPDISVTRSRPVFIYGTVSDIYCLVDVKYESGGAIVEEQLVFYVYLA